MGSAVSSGQEFVTGTRGQREYRQNAKLKANKEKKERLRAMGTAREQQRLNEETKLEDDRNAIIEYRNKRKADQASAQGRSSTILTGELAKKKKKTNDTVLGSSLGTNSSGKTLLGQ